MMPQTMKLLCALKTEVRFPIEAKELEQACRAVEELKKLPEIRYDLIMESKERIKIEYYFCDEVYERIAENMLLELV